MAHIRRNDKLAEARASAGLTQVQLAEQAGVAQSVISSLESGHVPSAIIATVRLARRLRTTVESLFGEMVPDTEPRPAPQRVRARKAPVPRSKPGPKRAGAPARAKAAGRD